MLPTSRDFDSCPGPSWILNLSSDGSQETLPLKAAEPCPEMTSSAQKEQTAPIQKKTCSPKKCWH